MSSMESLRTQMDNLRLEVQWLQVENTRLRDDNLEVAAELDAFGRLRNANKRSRTLKLSRKTLHHSKHRDGHFTLYGSHSLN